MDELVKKLNDRNAVIGVMGLGYVGLPLSLAFSKKFIVYGFDINDQLINKLSKGISNIPDIDDKLLMDRLNISFFPTSDFIKLADCDIIIICVPTPLNERKEPDLSYIINSCDAIAKKIKKGQFVILESTTYPGTTEEMLVPILEKSGLKAGYDFGVAFSPERIDPGNKKYTVEKIPKVVGGINDECTEIAALLYGSIIDKVIKVKDAKTAESVKMVENIFRNVNIALVNEMSIIFSKMNIDTWEVINAASTKPYGFMPFYPGPGIGGHCIPLDPYYMSYKAKKYDFIPRFIEAAGEINEFMKLYTVNLVEKGLNKVDKKIFGSTIAIMGIAYKKNINDTRESPTINIIEELVKLGAHIKVYDPYVKSIKTKQGIFYSEESIETTVYGVDCVLFIVDHDLFNDLNMENLVKNMNSPVIVDCKNLVKKTDGLIYYGIGKAN